MELNAISKTMGRDITEDDVRDMIKFILEWMGEQLKISKIEKLNDVDKEMLFESIIEPPNWYVKATSFEHEAFEHIHRLVKLSFEIKEIQKELEEIWRKRKNDSIEHIEKLIETYEKRTFGPNKARQLRVLRKNPKMKEKLKEIERDARKAAISRPKRYEYLLKLNRLIITKSWLENRTFPFSEIDFQRKLNDKPPISGISYKIWKPYFLHPLFIYEDEYETFPLKWLGARISLWQLHYFYLRWKDGEDLDTIIETYYDGEDSFDTMIKKSRSNPIGFRRIHLLKEVIDNYRDERYASVVAISLTQMEGLIWDIAVLVHNIGTEKIFNMNRKASYINCRDYELLDEEGKIIEAEPTVGLLINHTPMKKYLYAPFLNYYSNELFQERNPILHGRKIDFGTKIQANKKLITLEIIISVLHSTMVNNANIYLQNILGDKYEVFQKELQSGNSERALHLLSKGLSVLRARKRDSNE